MSASDELRIGGRNRFSQFIAGHPGNPHRLASLPDPGKVADDMHEITWLWRPSHLAERRLVTGMRRGLDRERAFEKPVPVNLETKHRPAQFDRIDQWSADDVLDHPRLAAGAQPFADGGDQIRMLVAANALAERVPLTRRRGPDEIKPIERESERVS
jgi:hypothetical protein